MRTVLSAAESDRVESSRVELNRSFQKGTTRKRMSRVGETYTTSAMHDMREPELACGESKLGPFTLCAFPASQIKYPTFNRRLAHA